MRFTRFFLLTVFSSLFFVQTAFSSTLLQLTPSQIQVKEGDKFTLTVQARPNNTKNYTVRMEANFPADLLSVYSWDYADDWMPLRKAGYDGLDNNTGVLLRTAGYPEGFNAPVVFGTITFVAKKSGTADVRIALESMVLDDHNKNIIAVGQPAHIIITSASDVTPVKPLPVLEEGTVSLPAPSASNTSSLPSVPPVPVRVNPIISPVETVEVVKNETSSSSESASILEIDLETSSSTVSTVQMSSVDMQLRLNNAVLQKPSDLIAISILENFAPKPIDITLDYSILDENRIQQYNERTDVSVAVQEVKLEEFKDLNLKSGKYTLIVSAIVGTEVVSQQQKTFEVLFQAPVYKQGMTVSIAFSLGIFFLVMVAILVSVYQHIHKPVRVGHRVRW